jgi:tripartite-type tricarboxylate transporter receptor subunit TctC
MAKTARRHGESRRAPQEERQTMTPTVTRRALGSLAAAALMLPGIARAAFPDRPLTLIVPFPPGGGLDLVSRLVARRLGETLRQTIVIENRTGAGGIIGFQTGARAAPDGYTLTAMTQNIASNPHLYKSVTFDALGSFRLLSLMAKVPLVLLTNPRRVNFRTLREIIDYAKANPGRLAAGNGGVAGNGHMAMELLMSQVGIEIRQIPYRGEGPMLNDLIGGQFDLAFQSAVGLRQHIDNGSLRGIAVSDANRLPAFPELPPVADTVPGFNYGGWWGLAVPAATPDAIANHLVTAIHAVLNAPETRAELAARGFDAAPSTPEEFRRLAETDYRLYETLVADRRITAE